MQRCRQKFVPGKLSSEKRSGRHALVGGHWQEEAGAAGILRDCLGEHFWLSVLGPEFGQKIRVLAVIDRVLTILSGLLQGFIERPKLVAAEGVGLSLLSYEVNPLSIFIFSLRVISVYCSAFPI